MSRKSMIGILSAVVVIVIIYVLWPSDEGRIRKLLKEGVKAVEMRDTDGVMAKVSFNYHDGYGLSYFTLKELLKRQFAKLSDISVEYEIISIRLFREEGHGGTVTMDRAQADIDVRVIATSENDAGYILGNIKKPARITATLDKERTKWLIIRTEGLEFW